MYKESKTLFVKLNDPNKKTMYMILRAFYGQKKNQKSGLLFGDSGTQDFDWYLTGNLDSSFQLRLY